MKTNQSISFFTVILFGVCIYLLYRRNQKNKDLPRTFEKKPIAEETQVGQMHVHRISSTSE